MRVKIPKKGFLELAIYSIVRHDQLGNFSFSTEYLCASFLRQCTRGVHAYQENTAKHLINFDHKVPEVKPSPLIQLETEAVWIGVEVCSHHHVLVGISEIECGNPRGFESAVGRVFSVSTMKSGDQQGFPTEPG